MEGTKRSEENIGQVIPSHEISGKDVIFEIERANTLKAIINCTEEQLAQIISELKAKLPHVMQYRSENHSTIVHKDNQTDIDIMKKELANRSQGYRQLYEPAPRIWVLSGLPVHLAVGDVLDDLLNQGILVVSVLRLTVNFLDNKYKYPNLLVYLEDKVQESKLDKAEACCKQHVTWKKLRSELSRCFQCQKFDHVKPACTNKQKCINCSEEHRFERCPKRSMEHFRPKCCNCGQVHWADSPYCIVYQKNLLHIVNSCRLPKQILFNLPLRSSPITETDGPECNGNYTYWRTTDEENEDLLASLSSDEDLVEPSESYPSDE